MKICSKCKNSKENDQFCKRGCKLQPWCKECNKQRSKQYYKERTEEHKAVVNESRKKMRDRNRTFILRYLRKKKCVDCGESRLICLEFDHVRGIKKAAVSELIGDCVSIKTIKEEIRKCEVVCANCHRIRTVIRAKSYRYEPVVQW